MNIACALYSECHRIAMVASNLEILANMALEILPWGGCVKPARIYKVIKWPLRHGVTPPCGWTRGTERRGGKHFIAAATASFSLEEFVIYAHWANEKRDTAASNKTTATKTIYDIKSLLSQ